MASHQTLAFSSAGSATVADLSRDLRDLGQVVDSLQRNLLIHPNLERELEHLREGHHQIIARENGLIKELLGLRAEMKELRAQQAEIMERENIMKESILDLKKGQREVHARQDDMKREVMRMAGC
jgi:chromosome segregation ATPase